MKKLDELHKMKDLIIFHLKKYNKITSDDKITEKVCGYDDWFSFQKDFYKDCFYSQISKKVETKIKFWYSISVNGKISVMFDDEKIFNIEVENPENLEKSLKEILDEIMKKTMAIISEATEIEENNKLDNLKL